MTTSKQSTMDAVLAALQSRDARTAADIAQAARLGRSTVGKALARLAEDGLVRRSAGGRAGTRRLPDRWSLAKRKGTPRKGPGARLGPGQLDGLVLTYLEAHEGDGPLGPSAVAKGLGRSSGAVRNCLARLVAAGRVRQTGKTPRRYSAVAESRTARPQSARGAADGR
jgi:predicted ArsR family transcriptional regulator